MYSNYNNILNTVSSLTFLSILSFLIIIIITTKMQWTVHTHGYENLNKFIKR